MDHAYIFDAIRTPRGKGRSDGSVHQVKPIHLLSGLLENLQQRNQFDSQWVDDIVIGCVTPMSEQGADIAKIAALVANYDQDCAGVSLNRFCASGLEAVNLAAMKVRSGWEHLIIAGGVESMSRVPMGADQGAWVFDPQTSIDTHYIPQGISADLIATIGGFDRQQLDQFAVSSHQKAAAAIAQGYFDQSVIPVSDQCGIELLKHDEMVRADCSVERLSQLKPSFAQLGALGFNHICRAKYHQVEQINHLHTAGNSSAIVDGAAAVLVGCADMGRRLGVKPRAKIIATALVGSEPTIMLTGPAPAAQKALKIAGLSVDDIDLFEVNEAFASVVLHFVEQLNVPIDKVNVNGGAIAMGHPLGATGAMLVGTLIDELERRNGRFGLVTLCAGAGMGIATIIERVEQFDSSLNSSKG